MSDFLLVFYAFILGVTLSFAAGPVFFVVIQTSISRGKTKALVLDLGAVTADVIFILIAYFGSKSLLESLQNNIWVSTLSGLAITVFGLYYFFKSARISPFQGVDMGKKRLLFTKGFLLNFLNIGVLFYWVTTTLAIGPRVNHDPKKMLLFYASILLSYLFIDLFKIYFANKFKERLSGRKLQIIEKILGIILALFGVYIAVSNFF